MTSPFTDEQLQEMAFQSDPTGAIARELLEARKDARRYRFIKDDRRGKFVAALSLRDAEHWDDDIDAALAEGK